MKYIVIALILLSTTLAYSDVIVKGNKTVYTDEFIKLTEGPTAPTNPSVNDLWRNTADNTLYLWDGIIWVVKRTTQDVKDEIAIFKANIDGVTDPKAKKCLKSLGKILLKLYKEE